jgi:hypothetical protein
MIVHRFLSLVFGLVAYPPGPILESVFLCCVSVDSNLLVLVLLTKMIATTWGRYKWGFKGPKWGYKGRKSGYKQI